VDAEPWASPPGAGREVIGQRRARCTGRGPETLLWIISALGVGRPAVSDEICQLVRLFATENAGWGYWRNVGGQGAGARPLRVHGEGEPQGGLDLAYAGENGQYDPATLDPVRPLGL